MLAGQILNLTLDPTRQAGKKSLLLENEMFFTYRAHFQSNFKTGLWINWIKFLSLETKFSH